jgi:tRNA 2-thiouridine synthesizing protein E
MTTTLDTASESIQTDDEGYLIDPGSWNKDIAGQLARKEGLELGDEHWKIIHYVRSHYDEHHTPPDARHVTKFVADDMGYGRKAGNRLFVLFPYGYVKETCKIAGMKRPRAWSTG